jgi:hypothetical protein
MWVVFLLWLLLLPQPLSLHAEDLGELSANTYNPDSTSNPFGAGSPFKSYGLNNPFSPYGSPFSNQSATNPFATDVLMISYGILSKWLGVPDTSR